MIKVILTPEREQLADSIGFKRDSESQLKGSKDAHGLVQSNLDLGMNCSIFGARLEVAAADGLGINFPGYINTYKSKPDLEPNIEVRGTNKHWQNLILRPGDISERKYVLVTKEPNDPEYHLVGYIWGKDAMVDRFWQKSPKNGRPAHWLVPQHALRPIEEMLIKRRRKNVV